MDICDKALLCIFIREDNENSDVTLELIGLNAPDCAAKRKPIFEKIKIEHRKLHFRPEKKLTVSAQRVSLL